MKRISNIVSNTGKALTIAVLLASVVIVQPAAAAGCATISATASSSMTAINGKLGAMSTNFSERLNAINANVGDLDKKITDTRTQVTADFEAKITELLATEGLSDAQTTAITQFKTDVQTAEATRVAAVDQARATYKTALADAVKGYQDSTLNGANTYKSRLDYLLNTYAKGECAKGKGDTYNAQVIAYTKADATKARAAFASVRGTNDLKNKITQAKDTRNQAITAANQAFGESVAQYTSTLATALNASATDTTQTEETSLPESEQ